MAILFYQLNINELIAKFQEKWQNKFIYTSIISILKASNEHKVILVYLKIYLNCNFLNKSDHKSDEE